MSHSIRLAICLVALFVLGSAWAQPANDQTTGIEPETTSGPVAHIYINSGTKILAYSAAANGKLTTVPGSPFNFNIALSGANMTLSGANGHYLFGFLPNSETIESLSMAANGALKKAKTLDATKFNAVPDCQINYWAGQGLRTDHSGLELYNAAIPGEFPCHTYFQSYRINDKDGSLTFQDNVDNGLGGTGSINVLGTHEQWGAGDHERERDDPGCAERQIQPGWGRRTGVLLSRADGDGPDQPRGHGALCARIYARARRWQSQLWPSLYRDLYRGCKWKS
jgi:hypothetical protein